MTNDELQNKIANQQEALNGLNKRVRELISERDFLVAQVDKLTADRNKLQEIADHIGETDSRWEAMLRDYETLSEEMKEMRRTHMLLPVDVNGVPIMLDDIMDSGKVLAVFKDGFLVDRGFENGCYIAEAYEADECAHVKTRTLEDVLCDVWMEALDYAKSDMWRNPNEVFAECADEIRAMFREVEQ